MTRLAKGPHPLPPPPSGEQQPDRGGDFRIRVALLPLFDAFVNLEGAGGWGPFAAEAISYSAG